MFKLLSGVSWGVEGSAMPNTPKHERNQPQPLAETLRREAWLYTLHKGRSHWLGTTWQHESTWPWDPEPPTVLMIHILQALAVRKRKHWSSTAAAAADFECANSHNHDWPGRRSVAIFLHLGIKFGIQTYLGSSWVRWRCINLCSGETLCLAARRSYRHCHHYLPNIQMSREKWLQIFANLTCETYHDHAACKDYPSLTVEFGVICRGGKYVSRHTWSTFRV